MLKKHAIYLLTNSIDLDKLNYLRSSTAPAWFETLEGIKKTEKGYEFYTPDLNTSANRENLFSIYERLRMIYGLKSLNVLPHKAVSSVVIRLAKILGYRAYNKRKFKRIDADTTTTVSFYYLVQS
tara:strand:- start:4111 stop:4485 length:375 start_codon:yes stop_codon:yes gene_type:complete